MASRRMKMKVAVNVTRSGRGSNDKGPARPLTPIPGMMSDVSPGSSALEVSPSPRSPLKHHFSYPDRSNSPVTLRVRTTSNSSAEDESHTFHEDEVAEIVLESEVSSNPRSCPSPASPVRNRSASPMKAPPLPTTEISHRAPGIGPPMNSSTNTAILSNMKKEIGSIHVANVTSNETLRQRLQKGTSSTTTKYSILRKEFLANLKDKVPDKKDLTILHFTFWNPAPAGDEEQIEGEENFYDGIDAPAVAVSDDEDILTHTHMNPKAGGCNTEDNPKKHSGPRVKVGPNGELIIDEESLVVETSESQRAKKQLAEMETIVGSGSGIFRTKRVPRRGFDWTVKETVKFYKALTMCGTDFSMMTHLFPKRTRGELKAKFKREDRKNSELVSQALSAQTFDPMEPMTESEDDESPPPPKTRRTSAGEKILPHGEVEQEIIVCQSEQTKTKLPRPKPGSQSIGRPTAVDSSIKVPLKRTPANQSGKGRKRSSRSVGQAVVEATQPAEEGQQKIEDSFDAVPPILRFDASDPLGFKVIPSQAQLNPCDTQLRAESNDEPQRQLPIEAPTSKADAEEVSQRLYGSVPDKKKLYSPPPAKPTGSSLKQRRLRKVNPRLPRVPGGGREVNSLEGPVPGGGGDEIEIEISCI